MCVYIFSDKRNAQIISVKSGKLNVVNFSEEVIYRNVLIETLHGKNYENSEKKQKIEKNLRNSEFRPNRDCFFAVIQRSIIVET